MRPLPSWAPKCLSSVPPDWTGPGPCLPLVGLGPFVSARARRRLVRVWVLVGAGLGRPLGLAVGALWSGLGARVWPRLRARVFRLQLLCRTMLSLLCRSGLVVVPLTTWLVKLWLDRLLYAALFTSSLYESLGRWVVRSPVVTLTILGLMKL